MINSEKPSKSPAAKIAIFDSGVGGVSFLAEIKKALPLENYIYYGDLMHAPYGSKTKEYIINRLEAVVDFLLQRQIKALVLACNTATSAGVAHLRQKYPDLIILGMEPAIQVAVDQGSENILVLSTEVTAQSPNLLDLIAKNQTRAQIVNLPCPGLMDLVETMGQDSTADQQIFAYLEAKIRPFLQEHKKNTFVLGCTHYIFLVKHLKELFPEVDICHGNIGTANNLQNQLAAAGLLREANPSPVLEVLSSADQKMFQTKTAIFLAKMGTL